MMVGKRSKAGEQQASQVKRGRVRARCGDVQPTWEIHARGTFVTVAVQDVRGCPASARILPGNSDCEQHKVTQETLCLHPTTAQRCRGAVGACWYPIVTRTNNP